MNEISNAFVTQKFNGPLGELTAYVRKDDGGVWFLATDVALALGYVRSNGKINAPDMTKHLDSDEISGTLIARTSSNGVVQTRNVAIISESGFYHAVFNRQPQKSRTGNNVDKKAMKANEFRKWVTSVVLPSIRKNGGYILGQENLSVEDQAELVDEVKRLRDMVQNKQRRIDDLVVERDIARNDARFSEDEAHYWQEQYERSCWN